MVFICMNWNKGTVVKMRTFCRVCIYNIYFVVKTKQRDGYLLEDIVKSHSK